MKADFADRFQMLPQGTSVLCAVSGGMDSMALLYWLLELKKERELRVIAAHFEHGLRGEESWQDAEFVREECRKLSVQVIIDSADVGLYAQKMHLGIEEAARILRYRFLEESAAELGCRRIATAHHADDQTETVMMNLCRGAGANGLAGIPPVRGKLIRPFLQTERETIEAYVKEKRIPYREDSSNEKDDYRRNRIRHRVIPLLKEENPSFLSAVVRSSELLRADEEYLEKLAREFLQEHCIERSIACDEILRLDDAVARRVLRLLCGQGLSMERCYALLRFAKGTEPGILQIPGKAIQRKHRRLYFPD